MNASHKSQSKQENVETSIIVSVLKKILLRIKGGGIGTNVFVLLLMILVLSLLSDRFFVLSNLRNVFIRSSIYVVLGVGLTFVLTARSIDISVGSIIGIVGVTLGTLLISLSLPTWIGVIVSLLVGVFCGLFIGLIIVFLRIPAIIVTLGTLTTFRGIALVILEGRVLSGFPSGIMWLSRGEIIGIPVFIWIAAIVAITGAFLLQQTVYGRHITAVGSNPEAARRSGINVGWYTIFVHMICGLLTALGAIMLVARLNGVQATLGQLMEMHTLVAVFIGGTTLFGGKGTIVGTVLGVLIIGVLENGLLLTGVSAFWQQVTIGLLLIAAVGIRTLQETTNK